MTNESAEMREREHAKLFTVEGRQVIAFLQRDDAGALVIVLQLWVAAQDHQLRVVISADPEEAAETCFESLNDESIVIVLDELGVPAAIRESEGRADG